MMRRVLLTALLSPILLGLLGSAALGAPAPAEPAKDLPLPKGAPPQLTLARMTKEGDLVTLVMVPVTETRRYTVQRNIGGRIVQEEREATVTTYRTVEQAMRVKGLQASYANGAKVEAKKLPALLAKRTLVLMSGGEPIDPVYLRAFKDNILVLSLPPSLSAPPNFDDVPPRLRIIPKR